MFSKSKLLCLLKYLCLISFITSSTGQPRYFLPIVFHQKQKEAFTKTCDPLVSFNSKLGYRNYKDCSVFCSVILEGLSASAAALAYDEKTLAISAVTYFHQKHRRFVPIDNLLPEGSVLNESHAPVILQAINKIVNEWETLGLYLGMKNEELKLIHFKSFYQIDVSRKDMIIHWLKTGTATREKLIELST
uniref:Death domain-containing protein n=1 Tax=Amphimedon queenslandica TaxID=400682 RepID=A0A1X7U736_AMPQE